MTVEAFIELVRATGPAGVVALAAWFALRRLHEQYTAVQEKRIADAYSQIGKLLEFVEAHRRDQAAQHEAQHEDTELLAKAIGVQADATRELRLLLENRLPLPVRR